MKFIDEYRDSNLVTAYVEKIHEITSRELTIMEICGVQTHTIIKYGIDEMLPDKINIVHGPGCPVCVTPLERIDKAIEIA